ncbi:Mbov_0401 family ICE element transposase-like protein [Spiroplasma endosymbiont of Atherix ibis]|uniref:Mbov_0401 family ICE element transposase-like protein n=1 Tax=Spiroplasma endosymbiont of Atherix ibis TaxID=3066291 RepID=UPI0030CC5F3B
MQKEFERIDLRIRYDKKRIACGWQIKDYRYRKIKTLYGDVSFLRTRYWNKFTKEVKVLVDQEIPIEKYQRIIPNLKIEILNRVGRGNRYCDIVDCLRNSKISEQTISNIVKKFNISQDTIEDLKGNKIDVSKKEYIYIETDDTFSNFVKDNKKTNFRIRIATIHTGARKGIHNRKYLENKKIDYMLIEKGKGISTLDYSKRIKAFINNHYRNYENKQLIILGDNATWINNLAYELGGFYVLDKYHLLKKLSNVFPYNNRNRFTSEKWKKPFLYIKTSILKGLSYNYVLDALNEVFLWLESSNEKEKLREFIKFISFIKRNSCAIKNYYKKFDSSSHTEGQVSSFVKQTLGYGKKIYGFKTFSNLLKIKQIHANGYDICELLEYEIETLQINNLDYIYKEVIEYKTIGLLWKDKKSDISRKGSWAKIKQPGFKRV